MLINDNRLPGIIEFGKNNAKFNFNQIGNICANS
jgi:hypothetical protein